MLIDFSSTSGVGPNNLGEDSNTTHFWTPSSVHWHYYLVKQTLTTWRPRGNSHSKSHGKSHGESHGMIEHILPNDKQLLAARIYSKLQLRYTNRRYFQLDTLHMPDSIDSMSKQSPFPIADNVFSFFFQMTTWQWRSSYSVETHDCLMRNAKCTLHFAK